MRCQPATPWLNGAPSTTASPRAQASAESNHGSCVCALRLLYLWSTLGPPAPLCRNHRWSASEQPLDADDTHRREERSPATVLAQKQQKSPGCYTARIQLAQLGVSTACEEQPDNAPSACATWDLSGDCPHRSKLATARPLEHAERAVAGTDCPSQKSKHWRTTMPRGGSLRQGVDSLGAQMNGRAHPERIQAMSMPDLAA